MKNIIVINGGTVWISLKIGFCPGTIYVYNAKRASTKPTTTISMDDCIFSMLHCSKLSSVLVATSEGCMNVLPADCNLKSKVRKVPVRAKLIVSTALTLFFRLYLLVIKLAELSVLLKSFCKIILWIQSCSVRFSLL